MFSGIHNKLTLYVQYIKNKAIKKWLPFELRCAVYLEYILTIDFIHPNQNLMIIYIQFTKTLAVKKWLTFVQYTWEYIANIDFVRQYPNLLALHVQWYTS